MKEKRKGKEAVNILIQISKINLKYTQNQNLEQYVQGVPLFV